MMVSETNMAKEPVFTRDFIINMAITMCCSLNYFTLLINIVGFATVTYGATSTEAGLAAGLYVLGGLVSRFFLGKYIELVGRKKMLVITMSLSALMSCTYFFASSLELLYLIRLMHGMLYGIGSSCGTDIAAKLIPASRRGEGIGYHFMSITVAMAVGPLLGMYLGDIGDYNGVFLVGLVMYTVAALLALVLRVPEEELTEKQRKEAKSFAFGNLVEKSAIPLGLTCMVFYFGYSGVLAFIVEYTVGTAMEEAAMFFYLSVAAGTFVSRITTGRIYDMHGPNVILIPGYLAFLVGMLLFATTDSPEVFLASGFVVGYGISIIFAVCQTIVVSKSPAHRYGVTTSTFSSVNDLGTGFGPMILGTLLTVMDFHGMYLVCAMCSIISFAMYWCIHGHWAFLASRRKARDE